MSTKYPTFISFTEPFPWLSPEKANSKPQIPNYKQAPNTNIPKLETFSFFDVWNFDIVCNLMLVNCNFAPAGNQQGAARCGTVCGFACIYQLGAFAFLGDACAPQRGALRSAFGLARPSHPARDTVPARPLDAP
jgi:hypothetical protein